MRTVRERRGLLQRIAPRALRLGLVVAALALAQAGRAATIHDESLNGDLSGNRLAPTALALALGTNSILGATTSGDLEYFSVTVPASATFSSLLLAQFTSADDVAFLAVQSGATFTETTSPDVANLLGWTHFGSGGLAGSALTGTDILDELGAGSGAIGFTPPLPSGTYTFWLQQTQAQQVSYRLDLVVVPEPTTALLLLMGLGALTPTGRPRLR